MKKITNLIVHCSDSEWGDTNEIRKWHKAKGWRDIGYHIVILNGRILPDFALQPLDGSMDIGRPFDGDSVIEDNEIGAHTLGYNDHSLGICGIAKKEWTPSQIKSLLALIKALQEHFGIPIQNVLGHCETDSGRREGKTCPNLDMGNIRNLLN